VDSETPVLTLSFYDIAAALPNSV